VRIRDGESTPALIAAAMVHLAGPESQTAVLEANCGRPEFLEALQRAGARVVSGFSQDRKALFAARERYEGYVLERRDFLRTPRTPTYEVAVGRPPYASWTDIPESTRHILTSRPFWRERGANGDWDLLYASMIWQVERLQPGGRMVLLTPSVWLTASGATELRHYLASHGVIEGLFSFGPLALFGEAAPTLIVCYHKGPIEAAEARRRVKVLEVTERHGDLETLMPAMLADYERMNTDRSYERGRVGYRTYNRRPFAPDGIWYLASPKEEAAVQALEESAPAQLFDVADIGVGPASGANEAFALSAEEAAALPRGEQVLVRHFVRAEHCARWAISGTAPYIFADDVPDIETFERRYPTIHGRLSRYRAVLEARYLPNNRRWWDWATVRGLAGASAASAGRIFVPGIDRSPVSRYSYSPRNLVGLGDVLTISAKPACAEDLRYLLAWLNSTLVEEWYRIKGQRAGARVRYNYGAVSAIPYRPIDRAKPAEIKIHDEIVRLTDGLLAGAAGERRTDLERQINQLISRLLSPSAKKI
jgi:hypothetical protein